MKILVLKKRHNQTFLQDYRLKHDIEITDNRLEIESVVSVNKNITGLFKHIPNTLKHDLIIVRYNDNYVLGKKAKNEELTKCV